MTIYDLKPRFQNLLRPLCQALARRGVTANQVTLFACALSLTTGSWIAFQSPNRFWFILLPFVLLFRMALNAIDGMLAREHAMKSNLGAILNELTDVTSDAALYLPFALLPSTFPSLVVFVVFLSTLTELTGVMGTVIGASRRYDGPMGKSDRAFVFGLIGLLVALDAPIEDWLNLVWLALIFLTSLTIYHRAQRALLESGHV
jgi:CDP-diacylglycerol---glycerol-3-phosphate 3-phosphatidyltransferase